MTQETLDINTFPVILLLLLDRQLKKWRKVSRLLGLKPLLPRHQPLTSLLLPSPVNLRILELTLSPQRVLVSGGITEHQAMPIKPAIVGIS